MWMVSALSASVLWGLSYVLSEQIYRKISVITTLGIITLVTSVVVLLIAYFFGPLKTDFNVIYKSNKLILLIGLELLVFIIAELLIGYSITAKNATLAGLIEISYPIFIACFAALFFKEHEFNLATFVGGLLIFAGVGIVYYFNK
jgi:drug/metabolite transporter (DMT)-like permease